MECGCGVLSTGRGFAPLRGSMSSLGGPIMTRKAYIDAKCSLCGSCFGGDDAIFS